MTLIPLPENNSSFQCCSMLPWVLSGILVVLNVFLNCSEQSGMIPMANCCKMDGNKTTIIIAYYNKIQENTSINAVLSL